MPPAVRSPGMRSRGTKPGPIVRTDHPFRTTRRPGAAGTLPLRPTRRSARHVAGFWRGGGSTRAGHADGPRHGRWVDGLVTVWPAPWSGGAGHVPLFFLGFNAIAVSVDIGGGAIGSLGIAFAFGLGLALAIGALGQISGGHFNPAVSLGLVSARKFPARELIPYWAAQLIGGFAAVLVVAAVYSNAAVDKLDSAPGLGISSRGALLLELVATALFVIVICTVATDDRAPWKGVMAPLLIGLFIFTAVDAVGPASGGSFNPARSLDPAIFNWSFGHLWIYLLGPLAGGLLGGVVWLMFHPAPLHEAASIRSTGGRVETGVAAPSQTTGVSRTVGR
jgi:MIP family channel proteins